MIRPRLSLNCFAGMLPSALQFTRLGTKTITTFTGKDVQLAADAAPFVHDPVTLAVMGLLTEGAGINLLYQSADLSVSPWLSQYSMTITPNQRADRFGLTTMARVADTDATYRAVRYQISSVPLDAQVRCGMMDVAQDSSPVVTLQVGYYGGTQQEALLEYDFSTKALTLGGAQAANVIDYGKIERADGIVTLWISLPGPGDSSSFRIGVSPNGMVSGTLVTNQQAVFAGCAQQELGRIPTSYMPAGPSVGTRVADLAQGTLDSTILDPTQGTLLVGFMAPRTAHNATEPVAICLDGGAANYIRAGITTNARGFVQFFGGGVSMTTHISATPLTPGQDVLLAASWKSGLQKSYCCGSKITETTFAGLPSGLARLTLGSQYSGTNILQSPLFCTYYFPGVLLDEELAQLTEV